MSLRKNFSWTLFGNVTYGACQWGMLAALAKLGSPDMVGRFALGLAVTAPIMMLSMLQLRAVQATDAKRDYHFGHYLALRLMTSVLAFVTIVFISYVSGFHGEVAFVILCIGLLKAIESISDVYQGLMQQRERMERIAFALMIKGPLFLLVLAATVYFTRNLVWGVVALVPVSLIVLFGYEKPTACWLLKSDLPREIQPLWQWRHLSRLAWLSLPMGVVMMLISLNTNIPRYFVERVLGERELGYFAALAYLLVAGDVIINALGQSASPRFAQYYAAGQHRAFIRLLYHMIIIGALLGLGGVLVALLFGPQILTLLYRADYAQHASAFVWVAIASGISFVASFLGYGLTATRAFQYQLFTNMIATTILAGACVVLIPKYGLCGGAIALAIGALSKSLSTGYMLVQMMKRMGCEENEEK